MQVFILFTSYLLIGYFASRLAERRGWNQTTWFWMGLFFGIFSLLFLAFFPDTSAPKKDSSKIPKPRTDFTEWYFLDSERRQQGPVFLDELKQVASKETLVWREGMSQWELWEEVEATLSPIS